VFNKRHDHVLRDIREAIETIEQIEKKSESLDNLNFQGIYFIESSYKDGSNRTRPMYLLTRESFNIIAMGLTGEKAMEFKLRYSSKFNEMEKYITNLNATIIEYPELTFEIKTVYKDDNE
jgi:Rha family phage regulatory protein